jgi:hypothetical protein
MSSPGGEQTIEIKPDPKDAVVLIDGKPAQLPKMTVATGRHVLSAARSGHRPVEVVFAVFPDTKSSLKVKLKKCDKREACDQAAPIQMPVEAATPEEPQSSDEQRPYLRRKS